MVVVLEIFYKCFCSGPPLLSASVLWVGSILVVVEEGVLFVWVTTFLHRYMSLMSVLEACTITYKDSPNLGATYSKLSDIIVVQLG